MDVEVGLSLSAGRDTKRTKETKELQVDHDFSILSNVSYGSAITEQIELKSFNQAKKRYVQEDIAELNRQEAEHIKTQPQGDQGRAHYVLSNKDIDKTCKTCTPRK